MKKLERFMKKIETCHDLFKEIAVHRLVKGEQKKSYGILTNMEI